MPVPTQPKTTRTVTLLDQDRLNGQPFECPLDQFGRRILVNGQLYDHCSTAPDGTWEFEPMK